MLSNRVYITDYLGTVPYESALRLQLRLVQERLKGIIPDVLVLLQHPPVFTIGRFRGGEDINVSKEILTRQGITVCETNRGGGTTYHGPGQLVGYPIINLKEYNPDIRDYIWKLEEVIIKLLPFFNIQGHRVSQYPGVWVEEQKICSIGIHVSHYITMHGFALNVSTNLTHFELINPCGLNSRVMTSLSKLSGHQIEVEEVVEPLLDCFTMVFGSKCVRGDEQCLAIRDALNG